MNKSGIKSNLLEDLFRAYYDARRNKRNTINALAFEMNYESNLLALHDDIVSRTYRIQKSICFINFKPVQREIFAADFRDRVVHHLIYNYIAPIFEKRFIYDSYSCRKGKGTHFGINRIKKFIRSCSQNYTTDCYILKLDIKGYFMAMNKHILYKKVIDELETQKGNLPFEYDLIIYLIHIVIFNDPTQGCNLKGKHSDWKNLPFTKSLFHAEKDCGLPIGNLTSQLFGNIYMDEFDHFIKRDLGIKYYGRYVDDFMLIHTDKDYLLWMIQKIDSYLSTELNLQLHPHKIYLQHYTKGVTYLGAIIKPHRTYVGLRIKGNFYQAIKEQNEITKSQIPTKSEVDAFVTIMNSYLGIMKHHKPYKLRRQMITQNLSENWWKYTYATNNFGKFIMRKR